MEIDMDRSSSSDEEIDEAVLQRRMEAVTPADRIKIREHYRQLIATAKDAAADGDVDINVVTQGIEKANLLMESKSVIYSSEGTYDAETLKEYSELFRSKVSNQKDEALQFNCDLFAEKLVAYVKSSCHPAEDEEVTEFPTASQWSTVGKALGVFLQKVPTFHYLYGSFDIPNEDKPAQSQPNQTQQERKKVLRQKAEIAPVTQPKAVVKAADVNESEETTRLVDLVWRRLKAIYDQNGKQPISYFEFVLDPGCFTQTVENMFYVSFLVKDGKAAIELDSDTGLPLLRFNENVVASSSAPSNAVGQCRQCIMAIDMKMWKELVDAFKVEKAVLSFR